MTTMTKTRQRKATDPTTWASDPTRMTPDPTTMVADVTRPAAGGERRSFTNGMTFNASTAASVSPQGATAGGDTVTRPAPNAPTGNDNASGNTPKPNAAGGVDSASTKPNATLTQCEQCGREFVARRPWGRFCSAYCRRRAWLDRNPEKAAELHERDIARLRAHIIGNDGTWIEGGKVR
jgi:hypothetical protein